ncbi:MAG: glutamate 5-kinase [Cyanobacteria bacterium RUI128]|nr:glutamate 5-kinase [Cyanobacteria bacterium RUI128]
MNRREFLNVKRIVVKLGTNVLRNENGEVALSRIYSYIESICRLVKSGKEVVLVTSGAVGLGKKKLGLKDTDAVAVKQACAAIGQGNLMSLYEEGFDTYGVVTGQILLTQDDFSQRKKYLSLRTILNKLLEMGTVPIINQNDTVTVIEGLDDTLEQVQMCFTDNDKLSALVSSALDADLLLILSDVDGLYNFNPKENPDAQIITELTGVSKEVMAMGTDASEGGRGGMRTKLEAARIVTRGGGRVLIANGKIPYIIDKLFDFEELGTTFLPGEDLAEKKRWIGYSTNITGRVIVNEGAKKAMLEKDSSLLPIGVVRIDNDFKKGEVVSICGENDTEFARGIVNYNADDCKRLIGKHSKEILELLGFKNDPELITRDYITIL